MYTTLKATVEKQHAYFSQQLSRHEAFPQIHLEILPGMESATFCMQDQCSPTELQPYSLGTVATQHQKQNMELDALLDLINRMPSPIGFST